MITVTFSDAPVAVVCHVAGDLDAFSASSFRTDTAVFSRASKAVVLDLTGVGFVDGTGLAALLGVVRHCHERGLAVRCCARWPVSRALVRVGFGRMAPLAASVDDALASLPSISEGRAVAG